MDDFEIKQNKEKPDEFLINSQGKIYTVILSNDLFESHRCTCETNKRGEKCLHIQAVLEYIKNEGTRKQEIEEDIIYLDVETQFSAEEVGGWNNIDKMKVAIAVIYSTREAEFFHYTEEKITEVIDRLKKADLVVGFNIKRFDYTVIQPYITNFTLSSLPTLDMLEEIHKKLGHRLSLNALAQATLNTGKSADGLQSVEWFKRGEIQKIIDYCTQDVTVTRDLHIFGRTNGHVKFHDKRNNKLKQIEVNW
jgi:DEAD/DEAH box helicase domain-containing protein